MISTSIVNFSESTYFGKCSCVVMSNTRLAKNGPFYIYLFHFGGFTLQRTGYFESLVDFSESTYFGKCPFVVMSNCRLAKNGPIYIYLFYFGSVTLRRTGYFESTYFLTGFFVVMSNYWVYEIRAALHLLILRRFPADYLPTGV